VLAPLLLSAENGLPAAGIGLVLAPGAIVVAVLSPLAGRLSDRIGPRALVRLGLTVILASTLFISAYAAGTSPVWVGAGLLGLGLGFAIVNSPNANAATATLSREESGVGLGIYQMIFFLGGGFGPAVAATFLAFRSGAGSDALNPLYGLDAAPFSDAFLLISAACIVAFAASFGLRRTTGKESA
jgi:MFS family permease